MRRSIDLKEEDWIALDRIAKSMHCWFNGNSSWRVLLRKLAVGDEVEVKKMVHEPYPPPKPQTFTSKMLDTIPPYTKNL